MLAQTDTPIADFLPMFAYVNVPVAFLVPTPNGYRKSIMDATSPVRQLLFDSRTHDYCSQKQGPANKVQLPAHFVCANTTIDTTVSLYRPITKHGDPRIWFQNLKKYCSPHNLLALIILNHDIYVFNLSSTELSTSLRSHGFAYSILQEAANVENSIANELRMRIQEIHNQGFLSSITRGDPGVGDTLENALGINRNNLRTPDYKGIELKTIRLNRNGSARQQTRSTLFTKVPDNGMTYHQILDAFGKMQIPRGKTIARWQLYDTLKINRLNSYGLGLGLNSDKSTLQIIARNNQSIRCISSWLINALSKELNTKHKETFWVYASSEMRDGVEYFRYDKIQHTKRPNATLLVPLIEAGKITVDLAAHRKPNGGYRDHGMLFKIWQDDIPTLLGTPEIYDLSIQ
ncbi:MAG: MvaI/BcnI family restriction endonuclease [Acidaminococcaceae bacterium]|jgi:hypothetical protein|nr:MvaI/BcnI family restriction endonuclease [Acidaminococcaceae bacterium]